MDTKAQNEVMNILSPHHLEHTAWTNELKFFTDKIKIFEHQLEKLIQSKDEKKEMLPRLEQFQNNFIRQKEVLDILKHDIKVHEQSVAKLYHKDQSVGDQSLQEHDTISKKMETFRKIFKDLKKDFFQFLKKWK